MDNNLFKKCKRCNINKYLSDYRINKKRKNGLEHRCKQCWTSIGREKREERVKKLQVFYQQNFDRAEERRKRAKAQREERRIREEFTKNNAHKNLEKCTKCNEIKDLSFFINRSHTKYRSGRGSVCKACVSKATSQINRERRVVDPAFKLKCNLRGRLSNIMNLYVKKGVKNKRAGSAIRDLGCSVNELVKHLETHFKPGMNWENYGNKEGQWSIDHIFPLSKLDLTDREQFLKGSHYTNLQPMWHIDNIKKSDQIIQS